MDYLSLNPVNATLITNNTSYDLYDANVLWESSVTGNPVSVSVEGYISSVYTREKESNMRGLYLVYIVDPETDQIIEADEKPIIATNEENAKLRAIILVQLEKVVDEYDIIVHKLGNVRPKKEVQEVKVIK